MHVIVLGSGVICAGRRVRGGAEVAHGAVGAARQPRRADLLPKAKQHQRRFIPQRRWQPGLQLLARALRRGCTRPVARPAEAPRHAVHVCVYHDATAVVAKGHRRHQARHLGAHAWQRLQRVHVPWHIATKARRQHCSSATSHEARLKKPTCQNAR